MKYGVMENREMKDHSVKGLRSLISEAQDPVFIVDTNLDLIFEANSAALSACGTYNPIGDALENVVHMEASEGPAFFNNRWLKPKHELISWKNKTYKKVVLKQPASVPDEKTLFTIRNMIAVLLHRLRSPMTGMQGYLDLIENVQNETDKRKLSKVSEGLDYMFEIMDELELLHHAEAFIDDEPDTEKSDAGSVVREILYTYEPDIRNRFTLKSSSDLNFRFNASELKQLLTLLIDNAVEHPSGAEQPITIEIESDRRITITNHGNPIPDDIASNLYFPFVTTKANNLGIGLSLAQLIAGRRRATIMLSENSTDHGICFSLLCSPEKVN